MNQPKEIPAFNTIQSGSDNVTYLNNTKLNGENNENTQMYPMVEDQDSMIIVPDFLQEMEDDIDQIQTDFNNMLAPEPEPEQIKPKNKTTQPMINNYKDGYDTPYPNKSYTKKKYNIVDIFTFEYEGNIKTSDDPNFVEVVKISYNQDFGNLRVTFSRAPEAARYNNVLFSQKLDLLVAATIYPTSAFKALNTFEGFNCTEVLINRTGEKWEKERPVVAIQQMENSEFYVWVTDVTKKDKLYTYHFAGWQSKAFKYCLEYCYGEGLGTRK